MYTYANASRIHPVNVWSSHEWILAHHKPILAVERSSLVIVENQLKSLPSLYLEHLQVFHHFLSFCRALGFVEEGELVHKILLVG